MARPIDADFLDDRCRRQISDDWNKKVAPVSWSEAYKEFLDDVWDAPTVDAVEVVRCKDCKHYREDSFWCDMNSRDRNEWFNWYPDDFCSYGERRTDVQATD